MILQILSILGLLISLYAFKIEYTLKRNKKYKALCEFNEKVSFLREEIINSKK